jgi:starch phosphorylase
MLSKSEIFGYEVDINYNKPVAYFAMEFAIDQSLKTYCGGLGYLAGSHMRSAYAVRQNIIGVGILWKYGYYDQARSKEGLLMPVYIEKKYSFLKDTGIIVTVPVHGKPVHIKAYLLSPGTFGTAPILLLSTDIPENDYLASTITHHLYDANESTRIAQSIVLGLGGAMALDALNITPDVYHMNEGHSITLNFYLFDKFKNLDEVKKHVVFTTHTPEAGGNEEHNFRLLEDMSFFYTLQAQQVRDMLGMYGDGFNYTVAAFKFSRKANGVSKLHGEVARRMWGNIPDICDIISITNAQNKAYWRDDIFDKAITLGNNEAIKARKKAMKRNLFKVVADQCGKLFDENILTIVWARRFAEYKRVDLIISDFERFKALVNNTQRPVQIIWAGRPYPENTSEFELFNRIISETNAFANCAVLIGYELELSALLKRGSDVWLNTPRKYREASGTSGMTAAMNGSINFSIPDGWIPEFAKHTENCFLIASAPDGATTEEGDKIERENLFNVLEHVILPMYYQKNNQWIAMVKRAAGDIVPYFDSDRLAREYYQLLYINPASNDK